MAITQAIANSFKKELFDGDHDFSQSGGDVFKIALYTSSATLTSARRRPRRSTLPSQAAPAAPCWAKTRPTRSLDRWCSRCCSFLLN